MQNEYSFTTNKNLLSKILKPDDMNLNIIKDAVSRINKVVFHTYNFINLYFIHLYESDEPLPLIDSDFVYNVMKTVAIKIQTKGRKSKNKSLLIELKKFFDEHYRPLILEDDIINIDKLYYSLKNYEVEDIVKNINNNITEHYVQYINKFVNIKFNFDKNNKELRNEYYKIKQDLLKVQTEDTKYISNPEYIEWIKKIHPKMFPLKKNYGEDETIFRDLKINPQYYIYSLIYINQKILIINYFMLYL